MKYKIGIIGGNGAFATSHLVNKIHEFSVSLYGAKTDADFLDIVTISTPSIFVDNQGNTNQKTVDNLIKVFKQLENIECNVIVIACNTLHQYWHLLDKNKQSNTIFLNLPYIVSSFLKKNENQIGIISSEQTRLLNIYDPFLSINYKNIIYPEKKIQKLVNICIQEAIENKINTKNQKYFNQIVSSMFEKNIHSLILGCTELSLFYQKEKHKKVYDSIDLLAIYLNQHFKGSYESL